MGTSEPSVEIDSLEERVGFDGCLSNKRKGSLGTLASNARTARGFEERSK
jgi:hypothetical protein